MVRSGAHTSFQLLHRADNSQGSACIPGQRRKAMYVYVRVCVCLEVKTRTDLRVDYYALHGTSRYMSMVLGTTFSWSSHGSQT